MDDSIIQLQIKVEHQAEEILTLSGELYAQQKEIAKLKEQMAELKERLRSLSDGSIVKNIEEETPPPHY